MDEVNHKIAYNHDGHDHEVYDLEKYAREAANRSYIINNKERYRELYFATDASYRVGDTLICDNGGFENGFDYYKGYTSTYQYGSDSCSPHVQGAPIVFIEEVLPVANRFEIVNQAFDIYMDVNRVKFGDEALKINSEIGHISTCSGNVGAR
ncbi:MAG: hypothetical protein ACJATI_005246 [Halioglobus sp.]|jgi:hypothetical protein